MLIAASTPRRAALAAALLAASVIALAAAVPAAIAQTAPGPAATRIDDRGLAKSSGKKRWSAISARRAFGRTLLRTRRKNATLTTRVPVSNGGSVTFQAGPKRGTFVIAVGRTKKTVNTAARRVQFKTVTFRGAAAPMKLTVTKPRRGVYLDAVGLTNQALPPTVPGLPSPIPSPPASSGSAGPGSSGSPGPPGPPPPAASVCPATTSDGGTLTSAAGTALRVCRLPGRVTSNTVLQRLGNVVYSLAGPVEVGSDVGGGGALPGGSAVTLTVEAGVVVIGDAPADQLLVNRGSRINAVGTATQPIVFTSRSNVAGSATETTTGVWGGIALLGRGPISDCNTAVAGGSVNCQRTLPGFTASYGGNVPTDTSGTLSHVQVRFAGAGTDGAGLRAAGVGNATVLNNLQVLGSGGDGLSVFGGRTSVNSLALIAAADDALVTDFGHRGTIQYLVATQSGPASGDGLIVADSVGNEDALPRQYTRVSNATLIGRSTVGERNMVLLRGGTDFVLANSVVTGTLNCLDIDETGGTTTRAADTALQDLGPPVFRSARLACPTAFTNDGNVTTAQIGSLFGSGTNNNNQAHTASFNGLVNGPNEAAVTATDPTTFNADTFGTAAVGPNRFAATAQIGAIQNATDGRFWGWTCSTSFASFPLGSACTSSPI